MFEYLVDKLMKLLWKRFLNFWAMLKEYTQDGFQSSLVYRVHKSSSSKSKNVYQHYISKTEITLKGCPILFCLLLTVILNRLFFLSRFQLDTITCNLADIRFIATCNFLDIILAVYITYGKLYCQWEFYNEAIVLFIVVSCYLS